MHILNGKQFADVALIEKILNKAASLEQADLSQGMPKLLDGKIVATVFYEPSTRTRLSFEAASLKLGAGVISVENARASSSDVKGETLEDTIRMVNAYADVIVLRHPEAGAAERAAKVSLAPVINAGDGANQHPSQALLDLYTIKKETGKLESLTFAFVGDLIYSRTLHSLTPILAMYPNNKFYFVSPKELAMPDEFKRLLTEKGLKFEELQTMEEALKNADVIYMTRVQKERFDSVDAYEKVKDLFLLKKEHLKLLKEKAVIMHPLPRVNEIEPEIDSDPRAAYFRQAKNGLYVRCALLLYALDI